MTLVTKSCVLRFPPSRQTSRYVVFYKRFGYEHAIISGIYPAASWFQGLWLVKRDL